MPCRARVRKAVRLLDDYSDWSALVVAAVRGMLAISVAADGTLLQPYELTLLAVC